MCPKLFQQICQTITILFNLFHSITNFNNTNYSLSMLTNISNNQLLSHFSAKNSRPLSAAHQTQYQKFSYHKSPSTFHNKVFKHLSSSKQNTNTLSTSHCMHKQKCLSEWNTIIQNKPYKKKSVMVIEIDNVESEKEINQDDISVRQQQEKQRGKIQADKNMGSVLINPDKILLPVKEYSNKFLREKKAKADLEMNHSVLRPKKSFVYIRKEVRKNRHNPAKSCKHNQNYARSLKTEESQSHQLQANKIARPKHLTQYQNNSEILTQTPSNSQTYQTQSIYNQNLGCTPDKNHRISTSRALEMFSKVYKNQGIQRMRIRKQVIMNKTTDVQVKQMILQDNIKKQVKKCEVSKPANPHESSMNSLKPKISKSKPGRKSRKGSQKCKKLDSMFCIDDENFQIAGW